MTPGRWSVSKEVRFLGATAGRSRRPHPTQHLHEMIHNREEEYNSKIVAKLDSSKFWERKLESHI